MALIDSLSLTHPIVQAPMAGVSTPAMAAAVSNVGALGSVAVGATDATGARTMIEAVRALTDRPFNVNLFAHRPAIPEASAEAGWLEALTPLFREQDAEPPAALHEIYQSFQQDDAMLATLIDLAPPVVSFHFGVPDRARISALKQAGSFLIATVTNLEEAQAAAQAGIDALVAQGYEAGGHRGIFDPDALDDQLGTMALTRLLAVRCQLPVIAAGGIMDGRGIAAALDLGAAAAQLGTAFIACPESSADESYRAALRSPAAHHTVMTRAISGRPARCLANLFTAWDAASERTPPAYPIAYDAGKALNAAAKAKGEYGYGAQWAGQGAPLARPLPAADLVRTLAAELVQSRR
ncbi:NAD(P)H-dependent flavin oxidoreductase [Sphingobium bisphenolivorans]|uniref:NAD(P)H-dependent flavin oxidoreductase n=1 Tax=Sphingobium bisphenolivorans TaxID=1335760 RepID=UPI0003A5D481|nr:nitronate monooxygenase [Sphingobium bisphenolivorans]